MPDQHVEYAGVAEIRDWEAVVELPADFDATTHAETRQVWLQVMLPDEGFHRYIPRAIPSFPSGGRFRISSDADDGVRVCWRVTALRAEAR